MTRTLSEWRRIQRRRNSPKLEDIQKRLGEWIEDNHDEEKERDFLHDLRGKIVSLSHDLYRSNGQESHRIRQKIRKILWDYSKRKFEELDLEIDLRGYRPPYEPKSILESIENFFKS